MSVYSEISEFQRLSRIIKRRSIAKEIADQGRILINGQPATFPSILTYHALSIARYRGECLYNYQLFYISEDIIVGQRLEYFKC